LSGSEGGGGFYEAAKELKLEEFPKVNAWLEKCQKRPASQKAMSIPG